MLNSVEAAVETLEDAAAVAYTISQAPNLKLVAEAASPQELIDKFLTAWEKLTPGIYRVDYGKTAADKRGGLCFRVSKTQPAAGSPQQLSGIGGPGDVVSGLQQQIWNLQKDSDIRELQRKHEDELRILRDKYESKSGSGLAGLSPEIFIAGLNKIESIVATVSGKTPPAPVAQLAGPADTTLAPGESALANYLTTLEAVLGGDKLVEVLGKLAAKGQQNPEKLRQSVGLIDML